MLWEEKEMDNSYVSMFLISKSRYFTPYQITVIRKTLLEADNDKGPLISSAPLHDPILTFLMSLFFGNYGVGMFILGKTKLALRKLILTIVSFILVITGMAIAGGDFYQGAMQGTANPQLFGLGLFFFIAGIIVAIVDAVFIIVDWTRIMKMTRDENFKLFQQAIK